MSLEKKLINNLKKIGKNRFEDQASKLLFKYCQGSNAFHYRLDRQGFDQLITQEGREGKQIIQHDTNMLEYTTLAFFRDDPANNNLVLPKKERLHRLDVSIYNYYLHKYFEQKNFKLKKTILKRKSIITVLRMMI